MAAAIRTRLSRYLNGGGMPPDAGWLPGSGGILVRYIVVEGVEVRPAASISANGVSHLIIHVTDYRRG